MKDEIHFPGTSEMEATLIICSEEPEAVAEKISSLRSIGEYRIVPQHTKMIHDIYFDKPDYALQAEKLALRIREFGEMKLITLKGPSQPSGLGSVKRLEVEKQWCKESLINIIEELGNRKINLPRVPQDFNTANPLVAMTNLSLKVIQDRYTQRQIRNIVYLDKDDSLILAELAIDSVVYNFDKQKIRHYEVEIEAKTRDGENVVNAVSEELYRTFKPTLRVWDYSKLATGKAINKLIKEGNLKDLPEINNKMKPEVYDKIVELLKD